jgi:hypothetical protein
MRARLPYLTVRIFNGEFVHISPVATAFAACYGASDVRSVCFFVFWHYDLQSHIMM